nr:immunoglobulin light chain junction region [Macaca mulatta]MOX49120.1 immunoglobulin light chain junction region [Macaca mulatta]
CQQHDDSPPTF